MEILFYLNKQFGSNIIFCLLFSAVLHSQATAESLPDPTRPFDATVISVEQVVPRLQSVLISSSTRVAIINGKRVRLGDQYAGSKLVRLDEDTAVLKGKQGMQTLHIFASLTNDEYKMKKEPGKMIPISNAQLAKGKLPAVKQ